jgi:hypothetical protein
MWIYIVIVVISAGLILGMSGCFAGSPKISNFAPGDSLFYPADSSFGNASRADVERRLQALADSPVPANLSPGAMCYEMAAPPDRKEYVCPVCGHKTIYTNSQYFGIIDEVASCRQLVPNIKNLTLRLEEKDFCHHCDGTDGAGPSLTLYLKYKGEQKEEVIKDISLGGLELIWSFMNGHTTVPGSQGSETPLKDYVDQIANLLKVDPPKP